MGVHGLWKLLEPIGKVVPLEGMAGKVLAVDVSMWLHQAIKGMHDSHGAPVAVAHLLILFHRLCKLLFYKIKPVFVFDGGVPALKRETMTVRRKTRNSAKNEAIKVRGKLLKNLLKHEAVRRMISNADPSVSFGLTSLALPGSSMEEELFRLPPLAGEEDEKSEEFSSEESDLKFADDIHTIDVRSSDFKSLPPEIRHEILLELLETRKQNSWKHLDRMPKELGNFSDFQMDRLLKRHAVQNSLDEASREMGGQTMSMKDLEELLRNESNPLSNEERLPSKRIAQDEETRYILIQKSDKVKSCPESEKLADCIKSENFANEVQCLTNIPGKNVETPDLLHQVEDSELSQDEIYNLIKIENEVSCPKMTKLSKNRKMNLTADVMEVLPLLGSSIEEISNCGNLLSAVNFNIKDTNEKNGDTKENINQKLSTETVETDNLGLSNVIYDNDSPSEKKGFTSLAPTKVELLANKSCDLDSFLTLEAASQPTFSGTIVTGDEPRELKKFQTNLIPEHDSEVSDESEDDLVPVSVMNDNFLGKVDSPDQNVTPYIFEKEKPQTIQVVISADKANTETDDIFSDIFTYPAKKDEVKNTEGDCCEKNSTHADEADNAVTIPEAIVTATDLHELQKSTAEECTDLALEQGKQERYAQNITEQMNLDAQELLRLFGVPYVIAPMEAEAQCAILNTIGLTDGTITDDSDIWLFGGKIVYRNFFNQKKHVVQYRSEDIYKYFKLSREDMIKIALLVGSDYTSGLEGVGPVTALEILGEFPSTKGELLSGLKCFQSWFISEKDMTASKGSLRRKIRNIKIASGFPSEAVVDAYLRPQVDESREPFSWAKPNVALLQKYTQLKFGWPQEKCRELLTPVIKKLAEKKDDTILEKYFLPISKDSLPEKALSKRVEKALNKLTNPDSSAVPSTTKDTLPKRKRHNPSSSKATESKLASSKSTKESIPQKRAMERVLEDRKRSAISIYKSSKKQSMRRKPKVIVKEINLSDSSSSSSNSK